VTASRRRTAAGATYAAGVDRTDETSTTADLPSTPRGGFERWFTWTGLLALLALVLAGATGLLGPRSGDTSATGGGYRLTVTYPAITRAGEPAPLHIRVEKPGGFDGPIQLDLCDDFFDNLDFQNWFPNPSGETGDKTRLSYEFDPPDGDVFEASLDARSAPGQFGGIERCGVAVMDEQAELVSVSFRTWRMP
jgi:hypothetical protein